MVSEIHNYVNWCSYGKDVWLTPAGRSNQSMKLSRRTDIFFELFVMSRASKRVLMRRTRRPQTTISYGTIVAPASRAFRNFAGGLAVIFPNPPSVEDDLSVSRWEKNDYCQSLGDFSLRDALQTKKFKVVINMAD